MVGGCLAIGSLCELSLVSRSSVARRPGITKGVLEKHTPSGQIRDVVTPVTRGLGHEEARVTTNRTCYCPEPGEVESVTPQCRALATAGGQNRVWLRGDQASATRFSVGRPDPIAPRIRGDGRSMYPMRRHQGFAVLRWSSTVRTKVVKIKAALGDGHGLRDGVCME